MFHTRYDNKAAKAARLPDARLSPELLLGMLQLGLWPAAAVKNGLGKDAEVFETSNGRRILLHGDLVMELVHDGSPPPHRHMQINWPGLDLSLDIRTLEEQGTP